VHLRPPVAVKLYYLCKDPYQLENRHDTAAAALVEQLKTRLDALRGCAGTE
jgi:hypothetical protein